jgi:hypothetical protein
MTKIRTHSPAGTSQNGFAEISIVASPADGWYAADPGTRVGGTPDRIDRNANGIDDRAEGSGAGAGIGAVVGGGAGLLAGLGLLAIPGLGPLVAAGWLASTALGAVVGGTADVARQSEGRLARQSGGQAENGRSSLSCTVLPIVSLSAAPVKPGLSGHRLRRLWA